jgi:hypothetical protein
VRPAAGNSGDPAGGVFGQGVIMQPRFIGKLQYEPQSPQNPPRWFVTAADFGQVTSDGFLAIAPAGTMHDGASIPWLVQPALRPPLDRRNRFWSLPHDAGYKRTAAVIDIKLAAEWTHESIDGIFAAWRDLPPECFRPDIAARKLWWDCTQMSEGMRLTGIGKVRRAAAISGVIAGGWVAWLRRK